MSRAHRAHQIANFSAPQAEHPRQSGPPAEAQSEGRGRGARGWCEGRCPIPGVGAHLADVEDAATERHRHLAELPTWRPRAAFWAGITTINRLTRRAAPAPETGGGLRSICDRLERAGRCCRRFDSDTQMRCGSVTVMVLVLSASGPRVSGCTRACLDTKGRKE